MSKLDEAVKDLILDKIVGSTCWHGDTNSDNESLENMEVAYELAIELVSRIYDNATLAPNAAATSSGQKLNKRATDMLSEIKAYCYEVV